MDKAVVFVVEDNSNDFLIIKRYLKKEFNLVHFSSARELIKSIEQNRPDCLLLDYHIGNVYGIDVLKQIKSNKRINKIPIMMLTNESDPEVIIDCMKTGADDYMIKDRFDKQRILASVRILVEKSSLQQRVATLESILPICAVCKKIRKPDSDYRLQDSWEPIEKYISDRTESDFSHGYCPDCLNKMMEGI